MGSTQRSDVDPSFGYSNDNAQDFLFLEAPEPAPGTPLLSDNEAKLLTSFFEDVTSDNYHATSFGEGLNFTDEWLSLPPQFMGTATSFGQTTAPPEGPGAAALLGTAFQDFAPVPSSMPPPPPPAAPMLARPLSSDQASADVLAAATLLQNGSASRTRPEVRASSFGPRDARSSLGPSGGQSLRHQSLADFRQADGRAAQSGVSQGDEFFAEMMFGAPVHQTPRANAPAMDLPRWGSDANFGRAGFTPQSQKETREALENDTLKIYRECLGVKPPSTSTPASSVRNGDSRPPNLRMEPLSASATEVADSETPPRKRRKSKAKEESDESDEDTATSRTKSGARRRRSRIDGSFDLQQSGLSETPSRRRKSGINGAAAKQPRENLTEEQKRENHIKSEQKRRTLIKEGFDDLCDMVPGLKGGGFSKSTMLAMAAEWLEELLRGNAELRTQLAELKP